MQRGAWLRCAGYITAVLEAGAPLEMFIEGGRSRDGRILPPKQGLLSLILDAVLDADLPKVSLLYQMGHSLWAQSAVGQQHVLAAQVVSHPVLEKSRGRKQQELRCRPG